MGSPGTVIEAASGSTPAGADPSGAATGRPRRGLAHEPALDGLRGAALLGIIFFHLERFPGGFLTVDLFFALSGFLITSLLLAEAGRTGSVGLGAFWARRARRLLPALWVTLVGVSVLLLVYTPEGERAAFRDDALATLFYVFNWNRLTESAAYWDLFTQPSPLEHMWTLAMEEQFYLFWPLATIGLLRWGRRRHERSVAAAALSPAGDGDGEGTGSGNGAGPAEAQPQPPSRSNGKATEVVDPTGVDLGPLRGAALALVVVAVAWMALAYEPGDTNFAYFSTVTRMAPMLLGALLASFTVRQRRRTRPPRPEVEIMAVAAIFVMVVLLAAADGQAAMYYQGGMAVFSLCSCVVIWAVTGGPLGLVGKVLSVRPLQWFGRVSYGVYLWHWPVIVFMTPDRLGLDRWATDVARLATTLVVAAISYRFLEQPLRRGALPGEKAWAATFFALLATLGFLLVATKGEPLSVSLEETEDLADQLAAGASEDPREQGADNPIAYYPPAYDVPDGAVKVLLVGDSGAAAWGPELAEVAESGQRRDDPPMSVAWSTQYLCSPVNADGPTLTPDGDVLVEEPCHDLRRRIWREVIDAYDPDVVVYLLANAGFTQDHLVGERWVPECHPVYDSWLEETLVEEAELLTGNGADFVFATSPYTATLLPGTADVVDCRNATYARAAALVPGSRIVDLNRWALEQGHGGLFKDSVHFSEAGARRASRWLLPILQGWYPDGCPGSAAATEDEPADPADRPRCTAQPQGEPGGADGDGDP